MIAYRFAALPASVILAGLVLAQPAPDAAQVYQKLVRSAVWIHSNRGASLATGTGSLIDAKHRLVLTNYHVVGEIERATVLFPVFQDGKPVAEREYYLRRIRELGISGRVIERDRKRDLAIIQLATIPSTSRALPLAPKSVSPGQTVHSIGNPGDSGALWVYTPGKVRQVYMKHWKSLLNEREVSFEAEVVETDSPTNPGDSGGPLVNDRGELAAVTQGGAIKANSLSNFIDILEVKKFLTAPEIRKVVGSDLKAGRSTALTSSDGGRFFSADALTAANGAAKAIYAKNGRDLFIESYSTVPGGKTDEVKSMKPEDRLRFFSDWAAERVKSADVHGIYLLVCREPTNLHVKVTGDAELKLHPDDAKKLQATVMAKFKEKKYDEGLEEFVKLAKEMLAK